MPSLTRLKHRMTKRAALAKVPEVLPGTLDMLILKAISLTPLHGYGVLQRISLMSKGSLSVPQGSLYPALHRLEHQGLIASEWRESEHNRRAKYYELTKRGRQRLREETRYWNDLSRAIASA